MHLSKVRIVTSPALGCVVDGRFTVETPREPDGRPPLGGEQIAFCMHGPFASLRLHQVRREPDELFSLAPQPSLLSLTFPTAVDLERLLQDMSWQTGAGARHVDDVTVYTNGQHGRIAALAIETRLLEAGLGVSFRGDIGPPPSDSRINADIVVPWEFLALQESPLANLQGRLRVRESERTTTPFDFDRPGLAGLAFDRGFGWPYFRGRFALQGSAGPSPCVRAQITDNLLTLTPTPTPLLLSDGFAAGPYGARPQLALFGLGYDAWSKILSGETTGRLELKGDGIGFLTDMSSMGVVAGRHVVSACAIDLALDEIELVLTIKGEVDRMLRHAAPPLPPRLGPRFDVSVCIPRLFLAARGVDLLRWGVEQKRALDESRHP